MADINSVLLSKIENTDNYMTSDVIDASQFRHKNVYLEKYIYLF